LKKFLATFSDITYTSRALWGPGVRPGGYPAGAGGSGRRYDESCMMFKEPAGGHKEKSVEGLFVLFLQFCKFFFSRET